MGVAKKVDISNSVRVYSPTHGTSAYAYQVEAEPKQEVKNRPAKKRAPKTHRSLSAGVRASLIICIIMLSAASLAVLFRYSGITSSYAQINKLKSDIESTQTRLRTLNVSLECSVNIKEVQEKAKSWGMTYPEAEQYVRVGDPLPAQRQENPMDDDSGDITQAPESGG